MKKLIILLLLLSFTLGNSQETKNDSILNSIELSRVKKGYFKVIFRDTTLEPNFSLMSKAEAYAYMVSFFNNGEKAYVECPLIEIGATIDLSKVDKVTIIQVDQNNYNSIESPLSSTTLDAIDILQGNKLRYVYYHTANKSSFPIVDNSTLVQGSSFEVNKLYKLIIRTTENNTLQHFYLKLEL